MELGLVAVAVIGHQDLFPRIAVRIFSQRIGDHSGVARVKEMKPLLQPLCRRDPECRMCFPKCDQPPDIIEHIPVFGFQGPVDPVDGVGRAETVRFPLFVLHHLFAGADERNPLCREQNGVYQFVDRRQLVVGMVALDGKSQFVDHRVTVVAGDEIDCLRRGCRIRQRAV